MEAVLSVEIIYKPKSKLEEKDNPSIIKDAFSSRLDPFIFTSTAPELLNCSNKTS